MMTALLFTDIEGSTRLWELHPGPMRTAHRRQRDAIAGAVAVQGGRVVKDTGDGVFAVFDHPDGGLRSAITVQRALSTTDWGELGDLRVRIGLHVGDADVEADGDLHGPVANRAARVMDAGHGGQILASSAFVAAIGDHDGIELVSLGRHRLKGLDEATELFQVHAAGLQVEFPPLRTLDGLPNNLPVSLSRFVGREDATAQLIGLIAQERLVTLVGAGGSGKTRLAVHVATELLDRFADGAWFVDLAGLGEPEMVAPTVAAALRITDQPGRDWLDSIVRFASERELLVVFDNCEHLLDATAVVVARLLSSSSRSRVVATSREILNLPGERSWPVSSLAMPAEADNSELVRSSESVMLFCDRAAASRPGFDPSDDELRSIVDICRRLDGMPLAIELAAARMRMLPLDEIAERLDDRFRFLVGGSRTAMARQRTLEATVAWSYQLLDPLEQSMFDRLSAFAGSFSLMAAERVCADLDDDVLDGIAGLVDKSLLESLATSGVARYRMLETLRMFGRDRLIDRGAMGATRDRLVGWVVDLVDEAEPELNGKNQLRWHETLDDELDNIRSALQWSLDQADSRSALSIAGGLHRYWFDRSPREGETWLSRALGLDVSEVPVEVLGRAQIAYGHILQVRGNDRDSIEWCQRALDRSASAGDVLRAGWAQHYLGRGLWGLDRLDEALDAAVRSMHQLDEADDPIGVLLSGMFVATLSTLLGRAQDAIALLPTLDRLSDAVGSPSLQAHTDETASAVYAFSGDMDSGRRRIMTAMEKYRLMGEHPCVAHALTTAAYFTRDQAGSEASALLHGKSLAIWEETGLVVPPWERIPNADVEAFCAQNWSEVERNELFERGGRLAVDEAVDLARRALATETSGPSTARVP